MENESPKMFGMACTVAWTELHNAMAEDGMNPPIKCGINTRKWIEEIVRETFATLRQQAGRVDEDERDAVAKAIADVIGHGMREKCYAHADAALAALAQNTQGDGEPVLLTMDSGFQVPIVRKGEGFVVDPHFPTISHAERARVPDVDAMVNRFLGWTLPKDFAPDAGISFTPIPNPNGNPYPWPSGTNLLDADQAKAMFEYVLATAPPPPVESVRVPPGWALVPIKPTEEMLAQAATHDTEPRTAETDQWNRDTWSFMLESAPEYAAPSQRAEVK